jgi:hypothetical protein
MTMLSDRKRMVFVVVGILACFGIGAQTLVTTGIQVNGDSIGAAMLPQTQPNYVVLAMHQYQTKGVKNGDLLHAAFSVQVFSATGGKIPSPELLSFNPFITIRIFVTEPNQQPYVLSKDPKNGGWYLIKDVMAKVVTDPYLQKFSWVSISHEPTNEQKYWEIQIKSWPPGDPCFSF